MFTRLTSVAEIFSLSLALFVLGAFPLNAGELIITQNGKSDYSIVLTRDASPSEKFGAQELQKFLKMISGVSLPIMRDNEEVSGPMILVGDGPLLRQIDATIDFEDLGKEGFVVRTRGPHLLIAGGRERGTMYGVYDFLEDVLGCKWYTHEVSYIPKKSIIRVENLNIAEKPAFVQRMLNAQDATTDADWAVRSRLNASGRLGESHGGSVVYQGGHSTYMLVSPYEHFADHPEYYSVLRGKRQWEYAQICASSPEVAKVVAQSLIEWIARQPDGVAYNIGQEDWNNWCTCPECTAINEYEESTSGTNILLTNRAAEAVEKVYPDKLVGTFAYMYTLDPPKNLKLRDNVAIRLAIISGCDAHPLEACPINNPNENSVKDWGAVCKNVFIWDYTNDFSHIITPFPNWWSNHEDLKLFNKVGIAGVFMQGCSFTESGGLEELQVYIQAKLLWNPNQDVWAIVDEFLAGYYGPAAPHMRQYIDLLQNRVRNLRVHFNLFSSPTEEYLAPDIIHASEEIFEAALKAAQGNPDILHRIETDRMCLRYIKLTQPVAHSLEGTVFAPQMASADYDDISIREVNDFIEACDHNEITALNEWARMFFRKRHMETNLGSHELVTLQNDRLKVDFVPNVGGRIFGIYDKKNGRSFLSELKLNKKPEAAWNATYFEDGFQFADADQEQYYPKFIESSSGAELLLTGYLTNNGHAREWNSFLEKRQITLPQGKAEIKIEQSFTALMRIQRPWSRGARQVLNLGNVADGLKVGIKKADGGYAWEDVIFSPETPNSFSRTFNEREIRQGSMIVVNPRENIGIIADFTPEQLSSCGISVNAINNTVSVRLTGQQITYQVGDTWKLTHSYTYLDDVRKFMN